MGQSTVSHANMEGILHDDIIQPDALPTQKSLIAENSESLAPFTKFKF
jgi:hypothetical protein